MKISLCRTARTSEKALSLLGAAFVSVYGGEANAAEAYCSASSQVSQFAASPGYDPTQRQITSGDECWSITAREASYTVGNVTYLQVSKAVARAKLSSGTIRLHSVEETGGTSSARAYLHDYLSIYSESGGEATLDAKVHGYIRTGGAVSFTMFADIPTLENAIFQRSHLSWADPDYWNRPFLYTTLNGATYDNGVLSRSFQLKKGWTTFNFVADASARGNSDFSHTIGIELRLPDGATMTSGSGLFLTEAQPTITPGVFFGDAPAVPEPATWALMILGFGATGTAMRYRRRRALAPA